MSLVAVAVARFGFLTSPSTLVQSMARAPVQSEKGHSAPGRGPPL